MAPAASVAEGAVCLSTLCTIYSTQPQQGVTLVLSTFCHILPRTLLKLPHSLFELSVKAQPWKPRRVQHGKDQRIKPRKPCNPASSQIYTWSNLSFSWFISLAALVQNEWRSRHTVAFPFTWSRFAASGCDSQAPTSNHPPPSPSPTSLSA